MGLRFDDDFIKKGKKKSFFFFLTLLFGPFKRPHNSKAFEESAPSTPGPPAVTLHSLRVLDSRAIQILSKGCGAPTKVIPTKFFFFFFMVGHLRAT